jgi:hypothetical protein
MTILQSLNRWFDFPEFKKKLFYGVDNFTGTEPKWDESPLIYAKTQEHPTEKQMRRIEEGDLDEVLEEIGGTVCGSVSSSEIVISGQPRLTSQVTFFDPAMEARYEKGELSLSTGFFCTHDDDGKLIGKVRPNHVLVFDQKMAQPRDFGAMFLNSQNSNDGEDMTGNNETAAVHAGRAISEKNKSRIKALKDSLDAWWNELTAPVNEGDGTGGGSNPAEPVKPATPVGNQDDDRMSNDEKETKHNLEKALTAVAEKETVIANQTAEIEKLKADLAAVNAEQARIANEKKETDWQAVKNRFAPGLFADPKKESEIRTLYDNGGAAWTNFVLDIKNRKPTTEEGSENPPTGDTAPKQMTVGAFNAKKQNWE